MLENITPFDNQSKNIERKNCILCNSKYRKEAEELFDRSKSFMESYRFLIKNKEEITYPAVRNHLHD